MNAKDPMIGQVFGKLAVKARIPRPRHIDYPGSWYRCECDCREPGCKKAVDANGSTLRAGGKVSCGARPPNWTDLKGKRFGDLIALSCTEDMKWKCRCDCGNIIEASAGGLNAGHRRKCGRDCGNANLIGRQFGHLTIVRIFYAPEANGRLRARAECKCDCKRRGCQRKTTPLLVTVKNKSSTACKPSLGIRVFDSLLSVKQFAALANETEWNVRTMLRGRKTPEEILAHYGKKKVKAT